jgi:hypothetical protein
VIRVPAETVLSRRLARELDSWERKLDPAGLEDAKAVLTEADFYGVAIDKSEISRMFTELFVEVLGGQRDGIDEDIVSTLVDFVNFSDDAGVGLEDHGIQNVIFDILTGPLDEAVGRMEKLEPESGGELSGVRNMLTLAKRFNFNVEDLEERIPIR